MTKSPFPGMDPYLESDMWPEFHDRLINQISVQLMPMLRPKYVALLHKYYAVSYVDTASPGQISKRGIYPDVHVLEIKEVAVPYETVTTPAVELFSFLPSEIPILTIEIRDVAERRLVTVIEILSPVNKQGKGFQEYMNKRMALLQSSTHLLEIDLLRAGERILLSGELPPAPYYVFLSRFTRRPVTEVWPMSLRERLPAVPVPLLPPDLDVPLSLQAAVDACFELVGYQELLDYTQAPPPPLGEEDLKWAEAVISSNVQR